MESGIRFVGPNCMGIWTSAARLNLCFWDVVKPGPIAFVSQSGTMGDYLFEVSQAKGYGFAKFVSSGNQASLDVCDYLEYLADDDDTKTIALYLEGVSDGRRFLEAALKATAKKPVLVYKVGRTEAGSRAAASPRRCFMPSEYCRYRFADAAVRPTRSSAVSMRVRDVAVSAVASQASRRSRLARPLR